MSVVHELFGYQLDDKTKEAENSRRMAHCPFMNKKCDGGGNRGMAYLTLDKGDPAFSARFDKKAGNEIACGVCSIKMGKKDKSAGEWIVCPRRILCFREGREQNTAFVRLMQTMGWDPACQIAVWREIKLKVKENNKEFHYNFDYILRRIGKDGIPYGEPLIVEIMTCSTSGGSKKKKTDIRTAFCSAILGTEHGAPGVNLRQVWARMASQLIVKSAAAQNWGGRAIWIIQDSLAGYISSTTGLDLENFRANELSEVNILAFQYNDKDKQDHIRTLDKSVLYAGVIDSNGKGNPCFLNLIKPSFIPKFGLLESALNKKQFDTLNSSPNIKK